MKGVNRHRGDAGSAWVALGLVLLLSGCTLSQAAGTASDAGAAAKGYARELIQKRVVYRGNIDKATTAEYDALMRAADAAERDGDMDRAQELWAEARALMKAEMPTLKEIKEKIKDFFDDD